MYSESILTPHEYKLAPTETTVPLYDAAELERLRIGLDSIRTLPQEVYEEAKIEVASSIASQVNRSLWFPVTNAERDDFVDHHLPFPLPLETIAEKQITNCFGYTLVTSECLEKVGIEHWIGFANGHSFLLLPSKDNIYYLDALSPLFNQQLGGALERGNTESIESQLASHQRAAVILDSQKFAMNVELEVDSAARKYPWLIVDKARAGGQLTSANRQIQSQKYGSQYKLIMSVFEQERGRDALEKYVALQCSLNTGDVQRSCMILRSLDGNFPELDARQSHEEIKSLATRLCATDPNAALKLVNEYFKNNFTLTQDSRIPEVKGDIMRKIARITRDSTAAQMATDAYAEAMKRPLAFSAAVAGKIASAECLWKELS